jgi:hypothetical protein
MVDGSNEQGVVLRNRRRVGFFSKRVLRKEFGSRGLLKDRGFALLTRKDDRVTEGKDRSEKPSRKFLPPGQITLSNVNTKGIPSLSNSKKILADNYRG